MKTIAVGALIPLGEIGRVGAAIAARTIQPLPRFVKR
jgi:hypothetical protein